MKEKQTQVGIRQMEYQRDLMKESLSLSAQNSVNEMERAKTQLQSDKEAVSQAKKGYEIAKVRFQTGVGTVLELNDSEVSLTRSQLNLNQTLYDFLKAKNEFEKVLGVEKLGK
jgi:outer membrane protein TolC